jgi:hypothetical protein
MKKILFLKFLLFTSSVIYCQKEKSFKVGRGTLDELKMTVYEKDSTAIAVVLYEHANVYLDRDNDYNTRTDYYYRIKILDKKAFDRANITIDLYKKKEVKDIKAITYNITDDGKMTKSFLSKENIFTVDKSENWSSCKFTLPNVKEGSVIEYNYSIISPYLGINDWSFQSDIPKIKSDFDASILGNYKYKISIVGNLPLDRKESSINKKCVYIDGLGDGACAIYSFGMNDIPAFKEEDYMLSKKNYMSRLAFDLESYTSTSGVIDKYTTNWKTADKQLKNIFFNKQTSKKTFFKKNIPEHILSIENTLEKAKKIYTFIQNHYTWNGRYWNNKDEKVKQAFNNKSGTAGEINLSLYNALEAADISSDLVILSTRDHGLPKRIYPVIFDFNYVIVTIKIDGESYFLDATDGFLPFGQVPFRALNGEGRIINFKKESNWVSLKPKYKSSKNISAKLSLNEDGDFEGNLLIKRHGYTAQKQRKKFYKLGEEKYLEEFEEYNPNIEIDEYKISYLDEIEHPLKEVFKVNILMDDESGAQKIRINPFFFDRLQENPFKLKERNYPVNFGHSKKLNFVLSLKIPESYTVTQLPKKVFISLPNKGGSFVLKTMNTNNVITLFCRFQMNKISFSSLEYAALKEFYNQIVIAENSDIVIEKK